MAKKMTVKTAVKAGGRGWQNNHAPAIRTTVKAGGRGIQNNHSIAVR